MCHLAGVTAGPRNAALVGNPTELLDRVCTKHLHALLHVEVLAPRVPGQAPLAVRGIHAWRRGPEVVHEGLAGVDLHRAVQLPRADGTVRAEAVAIQEKLHGAVDPRHPRRSVRLHHCADARGEDHSVRVSLQGPIVGHEAAVLLDQLPSLLEGHGVEPGARGGPGRRVAHLLLGRGDRAREPVAREPRLAAVAEDRILVAEEDAPLFVDLHPDQLELGAVGPRDAEAEERREPPGGGGCHRCRKALLDWILRGGAQGFAA
mmetsp:Transcript_3530/g.10595  ORF Transcript_3530/g.10595 Transcript_3530/m.10595 type:complete len:261 (-) Transcript_3530:665-1447(-)